MTLAAYQQAMKDLLMAPQGETALSSPKAFKRWLAQTRMSAEEQAVCLTQPLERFDQYRFMVHSNVDEILKIIYPYTYRLLQPDWESLVARYVDTCPNPSYRILAIGEAFPEFLETHSAALAQYPYIAELAWYEWIEAELLNAPDPAYPADLTTDIPKSEAQLADYAPIINRVATALQLDYPIPGLVAQLEANEDDEPDTLTPKTTLLWVFRQARPPYICRYFEMEPLPATWLVAVQSAREAHPEGNPSYLDTLSPILQTLQAQTPGLNVSQWMASFLRTLAMLQEQGILLGSVAL